MALTFTLSGAHLSVVEVVPGRSGEGRRVREAVLALSPHVVAADCDMEEALALRRAASEGRLPEADWLLKAYLKAIGHGPLTPADHGLLGAAQAAREKQANFVPLRPAAKAPGLLRRTTLSRNLAETLPAGAPEERIRAFDARVRAIPDLKEAEDASETTSESRLRDLLFKEQATRVVAVLNVPRSERILARLLGGKPEEEVARVARDPNASSALR